eukprot:TRINITY_DN20232_c0_g1_i2.p1 TRINITY_DN20232_c0_g1~~TRINITY_DN20232_c0_g1_i2.p1  ORF type:complete len:915 (+),score=192.45 TRINITY_DN20232_c0_g1_i2:37-2745(+)
MSYSCLYCGNACPEVNPSLCPVCIKYGIRSYFCARECYQQNFSEHKQEYHNLKELKQRRRTFENSGLESGDDWAEAGFYYFPKTQRDTTKTKRCKCVSCEIEVEVDKVTKPPWLYHRQKKKDCELVVKKFSETTVLDPKVEWRCVCKAINNYDDERCTACDNADDADYVQCMSSCHLVVTISPSSPLRVYTTAIARLLGVPRGNLYFSYNNNELNDLKTPTDLNVRHPDRIRVEFYNCHFKFSKPINFYQLLVPNGVDGLCEHLNKPQNREPIQIKCSPSGFVDLPILKHENILLEHLSVGCEGGACFEALNQIGNIKPGSLASINLSDERFSCFKDPITGKVKPSVDNILRCFGFIELVFQPSRHFPHAHEIMKTGLAELLSDSATDIEKENGPQYLETMRKLTTEVRKKQLEEDAPLGEERGYLSNLLKDFCTAWIVEKEIAKTARSKTDFSHRCELLIDECINKLCILQRDQLMTPVEILQSESSSSPAYPDSPLSRSDSDCSTDESEDEIEYLISYESNVREVTKKQEQSDRGSLSASQQCEKSRIEEFEKELGEVVEDERRLREDLVKLQRTSNKTLQKNQRGEKILVENEPKQRETIIKASHKGILRLAEDVEHAVRNFVISEQKKTFNQKTSSLSHLKRLQKVDDRQTKNREDLLTNEVKDFNKMFIALESNIRKCLMTMESRERSTCGAIKTEGTQTASLLEKERVLDELREEMLATEIDIRDSIIEEERFAIDDFLSAEEEERIQAIAAASLDEDSFPSLCCTDKTEPLPDEAIIDKMTPVSKPLGEDVQFLSEILDIVNAERDTYKPPPQPPTRSVKDKEESYDRAVQAATDSIDMLKLDMLLTTKEVTDGDSRVWVPWNPIQQREVDLATVITTLMNHTDSLQRRLDEATK